MVLDPNEMSRLYSQVGQQDIPDVLDDRTGASDLVQRYRQFLESRGQFDPRSDAELTLAMGDELRMRQADEGLSGAKALSIENTNQQFRDDYLDLDLQRADSGMGAEFATGFETAGRGLVGTVSGAYGLTGLPGGESAYQFGVDVQTNAPRASVRKFEDIFRANGISLEAASQYLPNIVGQAIPSLAEAIGVTLIGAKTAGAGAAALYGARKGVQEGVKAKMRQALRDSMKNKVSAKGKVYGSNHKLVRDGIKKADELMDPEDYAAELWSLRGATGSALLNSLALNSGEIYNTLRGDGFSHEESQLSALAYGSMAALPDSILPAWVGKSFLRRSGMMGQSKEAKNQALGWFNQQVKRLGDSTPGKLGFGVVTEGSTEAFQELINTAAPAWKRGEDIVWDDFLKSKMLNAGIIGAVAGGMGSLGTLGKSPKPEAVDQTDLPTDTSSYSDRPVGETPAGAIVSFTGNSGDPQIGRVVRTTGRGVEIEPILEFDTSGDVAGVKRTGPAVIIPQDTIIGVPTAEDFAKVGAIAEGMTEEQVQQEVEKAEAALDALQEDNRKPVEAERLELEAERDRIEQNLAKGATAVAEEDARSDPDYDPNARLAEIESILDSFPDADTDTVTEDIPPDLEPTEEEYRQARDELVPPEKEYEDQLDNLTNDDIGYLESILKQIERTKNYKKTGVAKDKWMLATKETIEAPDRKGYKLSPGIEISSDLEGSTIEEIVDNLQPIKKSIQDKLDQFRINEGEAEFIAEVEKVIDYIENDSRSFLRSWSGLTGGNADGTSDPNMTSMFAEKGVRWSNPVFRSLQRHPDSLMKDSRKKLKEILAEKKELIVYLKNDRRMQQIKTELDQDAVIEKRARELARERVKKSGQRTKGKIEQTLEKGAKDTELTALKRKRTAAKNKLKKLEQEGKTVKNGGKFKSTNSKRYKKHREKIEAQRKVVKDLDNQIKSGQPEPKAEPEPVKTTPPKPAVKINKREVEILESKLQKATEQERLAQSDYDQSVAEAEGKTNISTGLKKELGAKLAVLNEKRKVVKITQRQLYQSKGIDLSDPLVQFDLIFGDEPESPAKTKQIKKADDNKQKKAVKAKRRGAKRKGAKLQHKSPSGQVDEYSVTEIDEIGKVKEYKSEDGKDYNARKKIIADEIRSETQSFNEGFITPKALYEKIQAQFSEVETVTQRWMLEVADDILQDLRRKLGGSASDKQLHRVRVLEIHNNFRREPVDVQHEIVEGVVATKTWQFYYPVTAKEWIDMKGNQRGGKGVGITGSIDATNPVSAALGVQSTMEKPKFDRATQSANLQDPLNADGEMMSMGVLFNTNAYAKATLKGYYYAIRKGGGNANKPLGFAKDFEDGQGKRPIAFLILKDDNGVHITDHTGRRVRIVNNAGEVIKNPDSIVVPKSDSAIQVYRTKNSQNPQWATIGKDINVSGMDAQDILDALRDRENGGNGTSANLTNQKSSKYATRGVIVLEKPDGGVIMSGISDFTSDTRKGSSAAGSLGVLGFLNKNNNIEIGRNNRPAKLEDVIAAGYKPRSILRLEKFLKGQDKIIDSLAGYPEQREWKDFSEFETWSEPIKSGTVGTRQTDKGATPRGTIIQSADKVVRRILDANLTPIMLDRFLTLIRNEYVPTSPEDLAKLFKTGNSDEILSKISSTLNTDLNFEWDDIFVAITQTKNSPVGHLVKVIDSTQSQIDRDIANQTPIESESRNELDDDVTVTEAHLKQAEDQLREQYAGTSFALPDVIAPEDRGQYGILEKAEEIASGKIKRRIADNGSEIARTVKLDQQFNQLLEALNKSGVNVQIFKKNLQSVYGFLHANNAQINEADAIIRMVVNDLMRPDGTNLLSLYHEATHFVLDSLPISQRTSLLNAIYDTNMEFGNKKLKDRMDRARRKYEEGKLTASQLEEIQSAEEVLVESVARNLKDANIKKGVIRAFIRKIRELFSRIYYAFAQAAGLDPMTAADAAEKYLTVKMEQFVARDNEVLPPFLSWMKGPDFTTGELASTLKVRDPHEIRDLLDPRSRSLRNAEVSPSSPVSIKTNRQNHITGRETRYTNIVKSGLNDQLWADFGDRDITTASLIEYANDETLSNLFLDMGKAGLPLPEVVLLSNQDMHSRFGGAVAQYHYRMGIAPVIYMSRDFGISNAIPTNETEKSQYLELQKLAMAEVLGHELTHHVTRAVFVEAENSGRVGMAGFGNKARQAVADWNELYRAVTRFADDPMMYGLTSVEEFISEARNNPQFQRYLKTIPLTQSLANRFKAKGKVWDALSFAIGRVVQPNSNVHSVTQQLMKSTLEAGAIAKTARKRVDPVEMLLSNPDLSPAERILYTLPSFTMNTILSRMPQVRSKKALHEALDINIEETALVNGEEVPIHYIETGNTREEYMGESLKPATRYLLAFPRSDQNPQPPLSRVLNPLTRIIDGDGRKPADEDMWRLVRTPSFRDFFGDWMRGNQGNPDENPVDGVGYFRDSVTNEPQFVFHGRGGGAFTNKSNVYVHHGELRVRTRASSINVPGKVTDIAGGQFDPEVPDAEREFMSAQEDPRIERNNPAEDTLYGFFATLFAKPAVGWAGAFQSNTNSLIKEALRNRYLKSYFENFAMATTDGPLPLDPMIDKWTSVGTKGDDGGGNWTPIELTGVLYSDRENVENPYTVPTSLLSAEVVKSQVSGDINNPDIIDVPEKSGWGFPISKRNKAVGRMFFLPGSLSALQGSLETTNPKYENVIHPSHQHGMVAIENAKGEINFFRLNAPIQDFLMDKGIVRANLGGITNQAPAYTEPTPTLKDFPYVGAEVSLSDAPTETFRLTGEANLEALSGHITQVDASEFSNFAQDMADNMDPIISTTMDSVQRTLTATEFTVSAKSIPSAEFASQTEDRISLIQEGRTPIDQDLSRRSVTGDQFENNPTWEDAALRYDVTPQDLIAHQGGLLHVGSRQEFNRLSKANQNKLRKEAKKDGLTMVYSDDNILDYTQDIVVPMSPITMFQEGFVLPMFSANKNPFILNQSAVTGMKYENSTELFINAVQQITGARPAKFYRGWDGSGSAANYGHFYSDIHDLSKMYDMEGSDAGNANIDTPFVSDPLTSLRNPLKGLSHANQDFDIVPDEDGKKTNILEIDREKLDEMLAGPNDGIAETDVAEKVEQITTGEVHSYGSELPSGRSAFEPLQYYIENEGTLIDSDPNSPRNRNIVKKDRMLIEFVKVDSDTGTVDDENIRQKIQSRFAFNETISWMAKNNYSKADIATIASVLKFGDELAGLKFTNDTSFYNVDDRTETPILNRYLPFDDDGKAVKPLRDQLEAFRYTLAQHADLAGIPHVRLLGLITLKNKLGQIDNGELVTDIDKNNPDNAFVEIAKSMDARKPIKVDTDTSPMTDMGDVIVQDGNMYKLDFLPLNEAREQVFGSILLNMSGVLNPPKTLISISDGEYAVATPIGLGQLEEGMPVNTLNWDGGARLSGLDINSTNTKQVNLYLRGSAQLAQGSTMPIKTGMYVGSTALKSTQGKVDRGQTTEEQMTAGASMLHMIPDEFIALAASDAGFNIESEKFEPDLVMKGEDLYGGNSILEQWGASDGGILFDNRIWQSDTILRKSARSERTANGEAIGGAITNYLTDGLVAAGKITLTGDLELYKVKGMKEMKEIPSQRKHSMLYENDPVMDDLSALNNKQYILDLIAHGVSDYVVNNRDGHAGNFGIVNGRIVSFDKGQSFRFYQANTNGGLMDANMQSITTMGTEASEIQAEINEDDGIVHFLNTQYGKTDKYVGNPRIVYSQLKNLVNLVGLKPEEILQSLVPVIQRAAKLRESMQVSGSLPVDLFADYAKSEGTTYKLDIEQELSARLDNMENKVQELLIYLTGENAKTTADYYFGSMKGDQVKLTAAGTNKPTATPGGSIKSPQTIQIKVASEESSAEAFINKKRQIVESIMPARYAQRLNADDPTFASIDDPRRDDPSITGKVVGQMMTAARSRQGDLGGYDFIISENTVDATIGDQIIFPYPKLKSAVGDTFDSSPNVKNRLDLDDEGESEVSATTQRTNAYDGTQAASNRMLLESIQDAHLEAKARGYTGNLEEFTTRFFKLNPAENLKAIAQRDARVADSSITDFDGNAAMTDRTLRFAGKLHSDTIRNLTKEKLKLENKLETNMDQIQETAEEINALSTKWRDANLHEKNAQVAIKKLIKDYVRGMDGQVDMTFAQGQLLGSIKEVEKVLKGESLSGVYRDALYDIFDGNTQVFSYIQAMAELGIDYSKATEEEIVSAINDSTRPELASLKRNKPLMSTLVAFSKEKALQMALLEARTTKDVEESSKIDEEIKRTQRLSEDQLKELRKEVKGIRKSVSKVYKIRDAYAAARLKHKRMMRQADKDREAVGVYTQALKSIAEKERKLQSRLGVGYNFTAVPGQPYFIMQKVGGEWVANKTIYNVDGTPENRQKIANAKYFNKAYLDEQKAKGKGDEPFNRMLEDMTMHLSKAVVHREYQAIHMNMLDRNLSTIEQRLRALGQSGVQVSRMVAEFRRIQQNYRNEQVVLAGKWEGAYGQAIKASGMDQDVFKDMVYDTGIYWIENTPEFADDPTALYNSVYSEIKKVLKASGNSVSPDLKPALEKLWNATENIADFENDIADTNNVLVEDPSVQWSNPLTGKRENILRRRIKYGRITIPRRLRGDIIATITSIMQENGWNDKVAFTEIKRLAKSAVGEDQAYTEMMGIAERLFANDAIVNTFLNPLLTKPGDPIFTAPPRKGSKVKNPIPQDEVMSAWLESGKSFPIFVKELFLNQDGDPQDLPQFTAGIINRLRQIYNMSRAVAVKVDTTPLDPNSHTPHRMMDARTNTIFPREWLEYDTYTKVDAGIHISKLASVAAFGRDSAILSGMLEAAKAEARKLALPLGELQQDPAYIALKTEKQRKEFIINRLGNDVYETSSKASRVIDEVDDLAQSLVDLFAAPGGGFKDMRAFEELASLNADLVLRTPKSGLWQALSGMDYTQRLGYGTLSARASGSFIYNSIKNIFGSIFSEGLGIPIAQASEAARAINYIRSTPGQYDLTYKELFANHGVQGTGETVVRASRRIKDALDSVHLKLGDRRNGSSGFAPFTPLSPFSWLNNVFGSAVAEGGINVWRTVITRAMKYIDSNPSVLGDPNFNFTLKHLGIKGSLLGGNERALEYLADAWAEHTGQSLLDFIKQSYNRKQAKQEIFSKEDYLAMYQIAMDDINLEGGIGSTPVAFRTNGILRVATPLLRWATAKSNAVHKSLQTQEGRYTANSVLKGFAGITAVGMPIGIAATMLMDEYDEEILGKRSNLREVDPVNLLPGFAMFNMLTNRDGQGLAILERLARSGNVYGLGMEALYGMAAWTDPMQGQRALGIDRILVYSQIANARDAFVNMMHSGWYMNYEDGKKLVDVFLGQAPAHFTQTFNNLVLPINENERRRVKRVDAYNYLRAAGRSAGVPLKKSGIRTSPTPLTSRIRQMQLAAYGDDPAEFNAILQDAIQAAIDMGKEDPIGSIIASWKAREPMDLFQRTLTDDEVESVFNQMNQRGKENVLDLIRLHEKYLNFLEPKKANFSTRSLGANDYARNLIRQNRLLYLDL